jgi:hypothetical protein
VPRRRRSPAPATGPVAELLALEAEAAAMAAGGDPRAVNLLRQVRTHLAMAQAAGDRDVAALFAIFAAEDRARVGEWWANPEPSLEGLDSTYGGYV